MNVKDIQKMVRDLGLKPAKLKKTELIRLIQKEEKTAMAQHALDQVSHNYSAEKNAKKMAITS